MFETYYYFTKLQNIFIGIFTELWGDTYECLRNTCGWFMKKWNDKYFKRKEIWNINKSILKIVKNKVFQIKPDGVLSQNLFMTTKDFGIDNSW